MRCIASQKNAPLLQLCRMPKRDRKIRRPTGFFDKRHHIGMFLHFGKRTDQPDCAIRQRQTCKDTLGNRVHHGGSRRLNLL